MEKTMECGRHVSHTALRLVLEHVARAGGAGAVDEVLRLAGEDRALEVLLDDAGWSSHAQFRRLLEASATVLGGDEALHEIGRTTDLTGGSMPSSTEMLQALGSPGVLFAELGKGHNGLVTFLEMDAEEVNPTEWLFRYRTMEGFEPYPAYCAFTVGVYPMTPLLFGYTETTVVEETCQNRGDEWCTVRVSWEEVDEQTRRITTLEQRAGLLERQLEMFQATVADLVLADDLESALEQVVLAASRAVRATGFVLAIENLPGVSRRVYSHGLAADVADDIAASLLAGEECDDVAFVVDIASSRRHYGRLAAHDPGDFMLAEGSQLSVYARLAATALDSATSLEEARNEAERARVLLALSASLAEITTTEGMATSLARAIPTVVGADRSVVAVAERERGVVRLLAAHGFGAEIEATIVGVELPITDDMPDSIVYVGHDNVSEHAHLLMKSLRSAATVVVPVNVDGQPEAWLVADVAEDATRLAPGKDLEARLLGLAAQAATALRNARLVEQIRHQALHDALTGLPNRSLILDRTEQLLARSRRDRAPVAALFLDLDGFKEINDTLGHAAGDHLLRAVAARLDAAIRESDTLARLGGDEFVVLVDSLAMDAGPELVAERLRDVLREPFHLEGREAPLTVTTSIGIATAGAGTTAGDLLRDADVALYQAKAAGKNCAMVFAPAMQTAVRDRLDLDMDLRVALDAGQYFLLYQPIFDLSSGQITGVEALLRWRHPERGVVQPDEFIPLLEENGLIIAVGRWVLEEACRQTAVWHALGHPIDISVNVSARQLESDHLVADVGAALALTGLDPTSLTVEITETTLMRDAEATAVRLGALKRLGVRVAIDDFGTGYSSLAYLRQFPVDALKIDRSFINAIGESAEAGALIHTLVNLGKALGLETLAEGIEETHQFNRLRGEDCDSGQGFLFARPLSPENVVAVLSDADASRRFLTEQEIPQESVARS